MHECATCGYQTKRKWSIDYHNNRKTPCKPKNEHSHNFIDPNAVHDNLKVATKHDTEYTKLKEKENAALEKEAHKIKVVLKNKKLKHTIEALKRQNEMNETNELKPNKPNKPKLKRGFVNQVTRNKVAASQKWCCRMCSEILPGVFHIDHTRPLRYGGEDVLQNVSALCIQCHAEKTQNDFILWDNIANEEMTNTHEVLPIKYEPPSAALDDENVKHEKKTSYALTCPICLKLFKTRAAKSQHKNKKVPCTPVDTSDTSKESLQEANERLLKEIVSL